MNHNKIVFISGHVDVTQDEFDEHYLQSIQQAVNEGCHFVIGNAFGVDLMAQQLLVNLGINPGRVTIYHVGNNTKNIASSLFNRKGGYKNHNDKDKAMTYNSDMDIAWVRSAEDTQRLYGDKYNPNRISGTQHNLNRRQQIKS